MKHIIKLFASLYIITMIFTACSPEEFSMGMKDVSPEDLVEGIAYKIEHDAVNPNIVYLTSLMGNKYTPLWNHPQGRSQEKKVTLKIPFAGNYEVQFGVETRGGIVWGPKATFNVKDMYAGFISDPLWTLISGGADKEKTWYLDLDENQVSRYFVGPLYFYGTADSWETVTEGKKVEGDSWNWCPDYKGNSWMMTAADFGSMTFSLKGAATLTVNHKTISGRGTEVGKYMLDVENHTMRTQDAAILHDINRDNVVLDWGNIKIMSLTENTMQLAVLRDPALSGEGACLLVYNFISKEYKDNWVPGEVVEPEPQLPQGWETDISQTVSKTIKWVLSPETPFNWAKLDGSLMNNWAVLTDYPDWTGFNASIPDTYKKFSLTMNSADKSVTYSTPDGTETKGTYTLDEKGYYTFTGVTPKFTICSWVELKTSAENQWRITKIEKDLSGNVKGMWVGVRDAIKPEYMVYHLIPQAGGGGTTKPQGVEVAFDNTKLLFGDLESKGNFRMELYNEYGGTKSNPPLNVADIKFGNKMEIKFTLEGITLKAGAVGSYKTGIQFASSDWSVQYWGAGQGAGDVNVTGNGTYTVSFVPSAAVNGAVVFTIDIASIVPDISDISTVKAKIDKILLY